LEGDKWQIFAFGLGGGTDLGSCACIQKKGIVLHNRTQCHDRCGARLRDLSSTQPTETVAFSFTAHINLRHVAATIDIPTKQFLADYLPSLRPGARASKGISSDEEVSITSPVALKLASERRRASSVLAPHRSETMIGM
jgi:hypothetical protein